MSTSIIAKRQSLLKDEYKEIAGDSNSIVAFTSMEYGTIQKLIADTKTDSFKVISVEELKSDIASFYWDSGFKIQNELNKKPFSYEGARTGLFKITCTEKNESYVFLFACFLYGAKLETVNLLCGSQYLLTKIMNINSKMKYKAQKPPIGIHFATIPQGSDVLIYSVKPENKNQKTIHHKVRNEIEKDLDYFFKNIDRSVKNGEKGTRKILIGGVQGTGKSGFIENLTISKKDKYSILFAKDLSELVKHLQLCSKYKIPTIAILEDCENYLDDRSSQLLNILSGSLEPINVKGSYIIMTTNFPEKLSDRIKNRPERIDDIYILSSLEEDDALLVTKQYFSTFLPENFDYETLKGIFTGYTGAEVMKFAQDVKKYADYKFGSFDKINRKVVEFVINLQKNKYQRLAGINTGKTQLAQANKETYGSGVGFNRNEVYDYSEIDD